MVVLNSDFPIVANTVPEMVEQLRKMADFLDSGWAAGEVSNDVQKWNYWSVDALDNTTENIEKVTQKHKVICN